MPKTLQGKAVPEKYWKEAKKLANEEGYSVNKDKIAFYKYTMGILKTMMSKDIEETTVAGAVAVASPTVPLQTKSKPDTWSDLIKK